MSIEGLWSLHVRNIEGHWQAGGVVVLETLRVFGGDSVFYYTGSYEVQKAGEALVGRVRVRNFALDGSSNETVFGTFGDDYWANVTGRFAGTVMNGEMWPDESPHLKIPVRLAKLAELP